MNAADTPQTGIGYQDKCFRHSPMSHRLGLKGGVAQIVMNEVTEIASQRLSHRDPQVKVTGLVLVKDQVGTQKISTMYPQLLQRLRQQ